MQGQVLIVGEIFCLQQLTCPEFDLGKDWGKKPHRFQLIAT